MSTNPSIISAASKGRRIVLPISVAAVVLLALWCLQPITVLQVRVGDGGRLVKECAVSPGQRITYTYRHSIQKSQVDEMLEVAANGHLVVRETAYSDIGWGLPADVLDGRSYIDPRDGRFHILDMSRDLPAMRVRVAFTAEQTLEVNGEKFRLDSLASPTTLLVISATQRSRGFALPDVGPLLASHL